MGIFEKMSFSELEAFEKQLLKNQESWEDTEEGYFSDNEIKEHRKMAEQLRLTAERLEEFRYEKMWELVKEFLNG